MVANSLSQFSGHLEVETLPSNNTHSSKTSPFDDVSAEVHAAYSASPLLQQRVNAPQSFKISGAIRRRISKACDQCNQLRTKCNGQSPCANCVEFGLCCESDQERRKRRKALHNNLAQQAAAAVSRSNGVVSSSSAVLNNSSSRIETCSAADSAALLTPVNLVSSNRQDNSFSVAPASEHTTGHSACSAFSSAESSYDPDSTAISDRAESRRIQSRIAQVNYRKKLKRRLEDLERRAEPFSTFLSQPQEENHYKIGPQVGQFSPSSLPSYYNPPFQDEDSTFSLTFEKEKPQTPPVFQYHSNPAPEDIVYPPYRSAPTSQKLEDNRSPTASVSLSMTHPHHSIKPKSDETVLHNFTDEGFAEIDPYVSNPSTVPCIHSCITENASSDTSAESLCLEKNPVGDNDADSEDDTFMVSLVMKRKTELVNRMMDLFWIDFNQYWDQGLRQCGSRQESGSEHVTTLRTPSGGSDDKKGRKRSRDDDDEDDQSSNGSERQPKRNGRGPPEDLNELLKFACPYRKHNPQKYCAQNWRTCALTPHSDAARVKQHLYRIHRIHQCARCKCTFKDQENLEEHVLAIEGCDVSTRDPVDGITTKMKDILQVTKGEYRRQSEADRWRGIYRLLFPNEEIPSPYFEPVLEIQDCVNLTPDREILDFQEYMRRQVPRFFRSALETIVNNETQHLEENLRDQLMKLIEESQSLAIASYRERQTVMAAHLPQPMSANQMNIELTPNNTMASKRSKSPVADTLSFSPGTAAQLEASFNTQASSVQASQKATSSSDSGYISSESGDIESSDSSGTPSMQSQMFYSSELLDSNFSADVTYNAISLEISDSSNAAQGGGLFNFSGAVEGLPWDDFFSIPDMGTEA